MELTESPIPPAPLEILAQFLSVSNIPSMESSCMCVRKQEDICGSGVPALNMVGVACVKKPSDMR